MNKEKPYAYIVTLLSSKERTTNVQDNIIPFLEKGQFEIYPAIDARTNELEHFCETHPEVNQISLTDIEDEDLRSRRALIYAFYMIIKDVQNKERNNFIFFEDETVLLPMFYEAFEGQGWRQRQPSRRYAEKNGHSGQNSTGSLNAVV